MQLPLTIFTATYNRCHLLPKLYDSLKKQTEKNFEWLIIDDASTDDTLAYLKKISRNEHEFNIRYHQQNHGGKHRALNKGFDLAGGKYFFPVDSDDWLLENAVENIISWINTIENATDYIGVSGLKVFSDSSVIGGNPQIKNQIYIDATVFERKKYNLMGDKAEVWLTDACRKHKFPEFEGEFFVTEAVCWEAMSANNKKLRWFNVPIYVCEYLPEGLTRSGANSLEGHKSNYQGYCYYIKQALGYRCGYDYANILYSYFRNSNRMQISLNNQAKMIGMKVCYYMLMVVISVLRILPSRIANRIKVY